MYKLGITAVVKYVFILIILQEPRTASSGWVIKLFYIHEIYSSFCLCHVILVSNLVIALLRLLAEEDIAAICGFRCRALVICLSHKLARAISHLLQYIVELLLWRQHHHSHVPYSHSTLFSRGSRWEWVLFVRASLLVLDKLSNSIRHNMCSDLSQSWAPFTGFAFQLGQPMNM